MDKHQKKRIYKMRDKLKARDWESNAMTKEILSHKKQEWSDRDTGIDELGFNAKVAASLDNQS